MIHSEEALLGFDWLEGEPGNVACYSVFAMSNSAAIPDSWARADPAGRFGVRARLYPASRFGDVRVQARVLLGEACSDSAVREFQVNRETAARGRSDLGPTGVRPPPLQNHLVWFLLQILFNGLRGFLRNLYF